MSSETENPTLKSHGTSETKIGNCKENRRLSRSPHPYALRHPELLYTTRKASSHCDPDSTPPHLLNDYSLFVSEKGQKPFFDSENRRTRYDSTTSSDSGTEADDESGPFLKGLPAPPPKLRKGLKDGTTIGTPSPLLTPSYLDEERQKEALEARFKRRTSSDEKTTRIREKFTKRRRAELIRRTTETTLFLSVGCIASRELLSMCIPQGSCFRRRPINRSNEIGANWHLLRACYLCINRLWDAFAVSNPSLSSPSPKTFQVETASALSSNTCGFRPGYASLSRIATCVRSSVFIT